MESYRWDGEIFLLNLAGSDRNALIDVHPQPGGVSPI